MTKTLNANITENTANAENAMEAKKINLKKAPAVKAAAPVVEDMEKKRAEINNKIAMLDVAILEVERVDRDGQRINATNWYKDITKTEKETLGYIIRQRLKEYKQRKADYKRELKETYFTLAPELKALQNSSDFVIAGLVRACVENMRNVVLFDNMAALKVEVVKALAKAGVINLGVSVDLLGYAMQILPANGYAFDVLNPQPVEVAAIEIKGLDTVEAYKYFAFNKAQ